MKILFASVFVLFALGRRCDGFLPFLIRNHLNNPWLRDKLPCPALSCRALKNAVSLFTKKDKHLISC